MRRILLIVLILFSTTVSAQGPIAYLYNKPVLCGDSNQKAIDMLAQIKADGMKPLMYWRGNSFNGDQTRFMSNFFVLYDHVDSQVTVIEQQDNGFTCIISGGTGDVNFQPDEIEHLLRFWSDK